MEGVGFAPAHAPLVIGHTNEHVIGVRDRPDSDGERLLEGYLDRYGFHINDFHG
jgi:hypothetical protein